MIAWIITHWPGPGPSLAIAVGGMLLLGLLYPRSATDKQRQYAADLAAKYGVTPPPADDFDAHREFLDRYSGNKIGAVPFWKKGKGRRRR